MRNEVGVTIAAFFGVVALSSVGGAAQAQSQQSEKQFPSSFSQPAEAGYVAAGIPKMPNPPGPAPKHDITGAWAGPIKATRDPMPPMTPAGEARFKLNKPEQVVHLAATNDTFSTSCVPLGFPRYLYNHAIESRGGMWFEPVKDRMLILMQYQRVWRDVWMDGRPLPKQVDARGFPDSRFYGYSIGHWDGDTTFVIDTNGMNDDSWLDENGHPKSKDAHIEERYTRLDQYTLQVTATLDDPKYYTRPWVFLKTTYYWMRAQDFQEVFCVPSQAIEYRNTLSLPADTGGGAAK